MSYRFRVYKEEIEKEKVFLKLENKGEDEVCLKAVDSKGRVLDSSCILVISPDGITLCKWVGSKVGLPLGNKGMVKIVNKEG